MSRADAGRGLKTKKGQLWLAGGILAACLAVATLLFFLERGKETSIRIVERPQSGSLTLPLQILPEGEEPFPAQLQIHAGNPAEPSGAGSANKEEKRDLGEELLQELRDEERRSREEQYFILPQTLSGYAISFAVVRDYSACTAVAIVGLAGALACLLLPEQKRREAEKARQKELTADYPELVTQLILWLSAGLTLRSAWEQILREYEEKQGRREKPQAVYEEMAKTGRELLGGISEESAYAGFGMRCRNAAYLRLSGLLEMHVRQGNKGLRRMLEAETRANIELQLQQVKRRGEELSMKLMLPLMLLFGLTLLIVAAPAWLSISGL